MDRITKSLLIGLLAFALGPAPEFIGWMARADQTIFQPTIFSTGSSLTINSGITATFSSGSTVNFTGATVTGLAGLLPTGGTTSQVLQKNSATNFDVGWVTLSGGGNVSNSGTPTSGQLALWTSATQIQGVTALPAANFPALTGDVTTTAGALGTTIATGAVTLAKMANMATDSILGRATATTGVPEVLTALPFAFTGDVTRPVDSNVTTLATVNSNVGSFTNANITVNAKGLVTAAANGSGGGGTPGGSTTQVQYNNAGAFGGISSQTTDGTVVTQKVGTNLIFDDPTDGTKQAQFDVSNIATGTTRTINVPNANSTTVQANTGTANQFVTSVSAQGVVATAAVAYAGITGTPAPTKVVVFTSGTTYTPTTGAKAIWVQCVGAGGGGGGAVGSAGGASCGAGGGGGGVAYKYIAGPLSGSYAMQIGAGGAGGSTAGGNGGAGTPNTSFGGGVCIASAGQAGNGDATALTTLIFTRSGGASGVGTAGDLLGSGGDGTNSIRMSATQAQGGHGGSSAISGMTKGGINGNAGTTGGLGGGGSGAASVSATGVAGGAGGGGAIIITEFF